MSSGVTFLDADQTCRFDGEFSETVIDEAMQQSHHNDVKQQRNPSNNVKQQRSSSNDVAQQEGANIANINLEHCNESRHEVRFQPHNQPVLLQDQNNAAPAVNVHSDAVLKHFQPEQARQYQIGNDTPGRPADGDDSALNAGGHDATIDGIENFLCGYCQLSFQVTTTNSFSLYCKSVQLLNFTIFSVGWCVFVGCLLENERRL